MALEWHLISPNISSNKRNMKQDYDCLGDCRNHYFNQRDDILSMPLDYTAPWDCLLEHCEKTSIIMYHQPFVESLFLVKFCPQPGTPKQTSCPAKNCKRVKLSQLNTKLTLLKMAQFMDGSLNCGYAPNLAILNVSLMLLMDIRGQKNHKQTINTS